jgi:hypothetical protein
MLNFKYELLQLQGAIKKQQLEIEKLQTDMQKLLNSKVKVGTLVKEQQKEFDKLKKENEKLREVIYRKVKKKELSCMQEVEFTDENIEKVREMAICMTKEQIARRFNMSLATYVKREKQIPKLREAFEVGQGTFMEEVSSMFVQNIRSGCKTSLFYYLNNKMRMKEDNAGETQITIAQDFLTQPLKIVGNGNYEDEISNKYAKIMSITVKNNTIDNENSET